MTFPPVAPADDVLGADLSYRRMLEDTRWLTMTVPQMQATNAGPDEGHWFGDAPGDDPEDRYAGVSRDFGSGIGVDTGVAEHADPQPDSRYREYYFGLSYDALEGRIWYTDDYLGLGGSKSFYEVGVTGRMRNDIALTARVGYSSFDGAAGIENFTAFVLSAEKPDIYGFGLNLQLVGSQDPRWAEKEDFRLMGTISKEFR